MAEKLYQARNWQTGETLVAPWDIWEEHNLDNRLWDITEYDPAPKGSPHRHEPEKIVNGRKPIAYVYTYATNRLFYGIDNVGHIHWLPVYGLACMTNIIPTKPPASHKDWRKLLAPYNIYTD